MKNQPTTKI